MIQSIKTRKFSHYTIVKSLPREFEEFLIHFVIMLFERKHLGNSINTTCLLTIYPPIAGHELSFNWDGYYVSFRECFEVGKHRVILENPK